MVYLVTWLAEKRELSSSTRTEVNFQQKKRKHKWHLTIWAGIHVAFLDILKRVFAGQEGVKVPGWFTGPCLGSSPTGNAASAPGGPVRGHWLCQSKTDFITKAVQFNLFNDSLFYMSARICKGCFSWFYVNIYFSLFNRTSSFFSTLWMSLVLRL